MTRLRALCALAVLAGALVVSGSAPPACASGPHAGLVVDTGGRVLRYCVALPSSTVSGAKLIELAGDQYGLDYHFGSGGGAVCRLAGVGPDGDDCFGDYPNYWGYWRGTDSGGWAWSSSGATSTTVSDGDVDGWAWGRGDDGSTHPQPPRSTFASVCAAAQAQKTTPAAPKSSASRSYATPPATMAPTPATTTPTVRHHHRHRKPAPRKTHRRHSHHGSDRSDHVASATPVPPADPPGPSAAGLAGIGAVVAIGGAGAVLSRRRVARRR